MSDSFHYWSATIKIIYFVLLPRKSTSRDAPQLYHLYSIIHFTTFIYHSIHLLLIFSCDISSLFICFNFLCLSYLSIVNLFSLSVIFSLSSYLTLSHFVIFYFSATSHITVFYLMAAIAHLFGLHSIIFNYLITCFNCHQILH